MIKRFSHATVYVLDHDRAIEFYTQKLGLELRTDARMGDFRWVTVGVPGQPELEIALMEPKPGMVFDAEKSIDWVTFTVYQSAAVENLLTLGARCKFNEQQRARRHR